MALLAVAYILIGGLAHQSAGVAIDAYQWGAHSNQVLLEIEGLQAAANKVEAVLQASARGATPAQEEELSAARAAEFEALTRLNGLTRDNPVEQQRISLLRKALVKGPANLQPGPAPAGVVELREACTARRTHQRQCRHRTSVRLRSISSRSPPHPASRPQTPHCR